MKNIFILTLSFFLGSLVIIFLQQKELLFYKKENILLQKAQFQVQESNIEKFLFSPFSITNQNQKNASLEIDFLKKIENMRMIDIQEKVIKQYF